MPYHLLNNNSIIHVVNLSLKIPPKRKFGLCKNMREIKDTMLKKHEPKKREIKDAMPKKHEPKERKKEKIAHTFKNSKRERGMTLEYIKTQKYFTHLHNLDQSV
jgi:hypothetical protein